MTMKYVMMLMMPTISGRRASADAGEGGDGVPPSLITVLNNVDLVFQCRGQSRHLAWNDTARECRVRVEFYVRGVCSTCNMRAEVLYGLRAQSGGTRTWNRHTHSSEHGPALQGRVKPMDFKFRVYRGLG